MTRTHFRSATLMLALAVTAGTASAQTVITTEPPLVRPPAVVTSPPAVVTTRPLNLTPAQRTTIYRTIVPRTGKKPIVHEKIVTEPVGRTAPVVTERVVRPAPSVQYVVGDRVPAEVELLPVPQTVVSEVPAVSNYRYMMVNGRLLLVDPVTSTVVAEIQN